ncbi:HPF/RaiA family ribosome-associated protein [Candidatus Uhrbacteria bacterium]|nr:HPF/RaiA family ribosome-associated protein [Candidatus Uhrbacteria bacterium]
MQTNFSFKNCAEREKGFARTYFSNDAKLGKIQAIVNRLNPDVALEVRAEKFVKKSAYKISLILGKPMNLFVSEDDHTLQEAIDLAKDKLLERLRKVWAKRKYDIGGRN